MVVRQQNDPNAATYDYDLPENSLILSDWTNVMSDEYGPGIRTRGLAVDSILINGLGCYNGASGQVENNCDTMPIPVFYMEYGKAFRFRVVSAAGQTCGFELTVSANSLVLCLSTSPSKAEIMKE